MIKYDPGQLKIGIKVEMEHTKSKKVSERIAKDHLREHPKYYTEFVKWEKKLKEEGGKKIDISERVVKKILSGEK